MRINKFLAQAAHMSRRAADSAVAGGSVVVHGEKATAGHDVGPDDRVSYAGRTYSLADVQTAEKLLLLLHKPAGYVVSRNGQGSRTIYDLLPPEYRQLQAVGRLDKDSSGLLLLTNDGELANRLTHPRYQKTKTYEITLDQTLQPLHRQMISDHGLQLDDGLSQLQLDRLRDGDDRQWQVTMREGRNRQIRRTFAALNYRVTRLHRTQFGDYRLDSLASGLWSLRPGQMPHKPD